MTWSRLACKAIYRSITELRNEMQESDPARHDAEQLLGRLNGLITCLPRVYQLPLYQLTSSGAEGVWAQKDRKPGDRVIRKSFNDVITYWDALARSIAVLESVEGSKQPLKLVDESGNRTEDQILLEEVRQLLQDTRDERRKLQDSLNADPAIAKAAEYWYHNILTRE